MTLTSAFKTPEGEVEFQAEYGAAMKLWPVPYEEIEVPGRFGMTYVVASGAANAPPLVLLHAFMGTLTMWRPYIADFSKEYRVYAIDTMGHPNRSLPDEPIGDGADFAEWLGETLNGLNLDRVYLAGISFGGWIALNFTLTEPERVRKLALLSPAASFEPLVRQFTVRAILSGIIPTRGMMNSFMNWMGFEADTDDTVTQSMLDLMWLGGKSYQMPPETRRVMPTVFSDEELSSLDMPVLLLMGEDEVIYDAAEALARARRVVPNLEGELVAGCRHDMCFSEHQVVCARVLEFLNDD